jgi:hypothetical protein
MNGVDEALSLSFHRDGGHACVEHPNGIVNMVDEFQCSLSMFKS